MAKVSIDRCASYEIGEIRDALHLVLGKIDAGKSFKGKRVLVKPNLLGAFPPSEAITTHPAIVEAVVEYIWDNGGSPKDTNLFVVQGSLRLLPGEVH